MKKLLVLLAVLGFAAIFAGTGMAAEWNFYGNARIATFYVSTSRDDAGINPITGASEDLEDTQFNVRLQPNSRIGAKVKHGDISGYFEYGTGVNVRKLYGTWDFGMGKVLVGQTYTPSTFFYSGQAAFTDDGFFLLGQPYAGRQPQLGLEFAGDWGLFKFAMIENDGDDDFDLVNVEQDTNMPKFELSYSYKGDFWFVDVTGGFQTYEIDGNVATTGQSEDEDIDSWLGGLGGGVSFGGFYAKVFGFFGQNLDQYGMGSATFDGSGGFSGGNMLGESGVQVEYDRTGTIRSGLEDTESFGGLLVLGYKLNDMISFEGGGSYNSHDPDADYSSNINPATGLAYELDDDEAYGFYIQAPLTLADGMFVVPEFGYYSLEDQIEDDKDEGDRFYGGIKWQINF